MLYFPVTRGPEHFIHVSVLSVDFSGHNYCYINICYPQNHRDALLIVAVKSVQAASFVVPYGWYNLIYQSAQSHLMFHKAI